MKKRMLFIILFVLMIPTFVKADDVYVSLSCPDSANSGSKIECKVNVTSSVLVNGLSANYTLNGLSYVSFTPQNGFTTYSASSSGFAVGNNNGKKGVFTIGIITLKVNKDGSIKLSNLDASDTNFNSYSIGSKSDSIRLTSTNNNLASLTLSDGTLSPSFKASTTNYTATVDASSVTIKATKGDTYQTISGTGKKSLSYGKNTFKVVVKSESGSSKTYTIVITRPDNRNTNNYLKSLSLDKGNISFNKNTTNYKVNVDSDVTSIKINASLEDSKATFVSGYGSRTVKLSYGKNTILVKVKAENESIKTYTINVTRKDNRSTNNYLKFLSLSEGEINFDKDTLEYNISVKNDITKIDITAKAEDDKATVEVKNTKLEVGNNTIKINVTSESEKTRTYTIKVKRLSEEEKMSDNNNISSINIFGHDLDFSNETSEYNITIGSDENELLLDVILEDENASYTVDGNENLKDGSIINVTAISESGIKKEFEILISKEKNMGILPYVVCSLVSLVGGFGLGLICSHVIGKSKNK